MAAPPQHLPPPFPSANYGPPGHYDSKPLLPPSGLPPSGPGVSLTPMGSSGQKGAQSEAKEKDGKIYTLHIEQQPIRARMCGFGDKDRRPITPPPCIQLIVTDKATGRIIPTDQVDPTFFVLQVDLWDDVGLHEKNVVRAASNSPATSISTATTTSFPPPPDRIYATQAQQHMNPMYHQTPYGQMMAAPQQQNMYQPQLYPQQQQPGMYAGGLSPQQGYYPPPPQTQHYPPGYTLVGPPPGPPGHMQYQDYTQAVVQPSQPQNPPNVFTRNLIGSLTVNAFRLKDTKGKIGHWFVLQDLSVRTEGWFRLKMNFIDVGAAIGDIRQGANRGTAPVLAAVFSQPFQVFSAKKFPGVIESTDISKTFAGQGIKIPIRKDAGKGEDKNGEGGD